MGINALVVDDSASMRSVVKKILKLSKVDLSECLEAENGREALDILESAWIDVIITDINMPVMDGLEFLRHLNRDETTSRIPTIVITTESRSSVIEEAKRLGAKSHVSKPFQPETIRSVLENLLGTEYAREDDASSDGFDF